MNVQKNRGEEQWGAIAFYVEVNLCITHRREHASMPYRGADLRLTSSQPDSS